MYFLNLWSLTLSSLGENILLLLSHLTLYSTARAHNKLYSLEVVNRFSGKYGRPQTLRESRCTKKVNYNSSKLDSQRTKTTIYSTKTHSGRFLHSTYLLSEAFFPLSSKQAHPKFRALNFYHTHQGSDPVEPDSSSASLGCSCSAATL